MATIAVRAGAGTGAQVQVQTSADERQGRFRLLTGAGASAGPLLVVTFETNIVADLDVYAATLMPGAQNAVFSTINVVVTPWTIPPVGVAFQVVAQLVEGVLRQFALAATGPLAGATQYQFGYQVF